MLAITSTLFISAGLLNKISAKKSLKDEITLKVGEVVKLEKFDNIKIKYNEFKFENACPENAQCIRAGDIVFLITLNDVNYKMDFRNRKNISMEKYLLELISHNKEEDSITLKIKNKV